MTGSTTRQIKVNQKSIVLIDFGRLGEVEVKFLLKLTISKTYQMLPSNPGLVMAPSLGEETVFAYFAITPVL